MSLTRTVYVRCDGSPGVECDEEVYIQGGARRDTTDGAQVRAKAKVAGWQLTKGLDLCPRHRTDTLLAVLDPA